MNHINQARENIKHILQQPQYQVYYEDHRSILQILWTKLLHWIQDIFAKLLSSISAAGSIGSIILIVLIIAVIGLVGFSTFLLVRMIRRRQQARGNQPFRQMQQSTWTYHDYVTAAETQEAQADYSEAVRFMFMAVLLYAHEQHWLEIQMWKTNWDYNEELKKVDSQRAQQFLQLASLFDEVFYGRRSINEQVFQSYKNRAMNWLTYTTDQTS